MAEITLLLNQARDGTPGARDELFARMYHELQRLARAKLARETTLSQIEVGSLINETYLRLSGGAPLPQGDRGAFIAYAASVMRSVIVDHIRRRKAAKRGSGVREVTLLTTAGGEDEPATDVEALHEALIDLQKVDERCHRIVELRYFAGLSTEQVAELMELSPATVKRDWRRARAFLYRAIQGP